LEDKKVQRQGKQVRQRGGVWIKQPQPVRERSFMKKRRQHVRGPHRNGAKAMMGPVSNRLDDYQKKSRRNGCTGHMRTTSKRERRGDTAKTKGQAGKAGRLVGLHSRRTTGVIDQGRWEEPNAFTGGEKGGKRK